MSNDAIASYIESINLLIDPPAEIASPTWIPLGSLSGGNREVEVAREVGDDDAHYSVGDLLAFRADPKMTPNQSFWLGMVLAL